MKKLISSVFIILSLPLGLAAQGASSGSGSPTPLQFAGETTPTNLVTLSTGIATLYDDNVQAGYGARIRDEALSFNSQLSISQTTRNVTINFDYRPFFMLYRQYDRLDRLNHAAKLAMDFRLSSRFMLGLHDTFSYQNGIYPTLAGQQTYAGPPSPTAPNAFIYSPTLRTLSNTPGLNLTFMKSSRTSLSLSAGYNQVKFASQAGTGQSLYNDTSMSGGVQCEYRATKHTTLGVLLLYQDSSYEGGQILGSRLRSQVASTVVSVDSQISPTVKLSLFGGPQYIRTLGEIVGGSNLSGHFEASGGGSVTKEVQKTALNLSAQRAVSDGGGLYTSVINTEVSFAVRRRLVGRWEASWNGGVARADTSLLQLGNGRTDSLTGGFNLSRPIGRGSNFYIAYTRTDQVNSGGLPFLVNFDRDQVTVGIDYQLKAISIGR
jgi:hypothetical protein